MAGLLAFGSTGCNRQTASQEPQALVESVARLRAALAKASPEVQSKLYDGVVINLRYGRNTDALMVLDRLASDPTLSDRQKNAVNEVI
jgi:hypothetical protein